MEVGLINRTIYRGKFSESSVGVPIAAVAGSNGQSPLSPVRQVGASRDLSEATRRGAVRALWGTVTHTQQPVPSVLPVAFAYSIAVSGLRDIRIIIQVTLGTVWTTSWITLRLSLRSRIVISFQDGDSSWRFPIIQDILGAAVFTGSHDTWSVRSVCNALLAFQGSRVRRYGSAVGPHRSLLKTFFFAIKQLHTSAFSVVEDHYRRHGSRRIGPHWSILKWRRITAFLKTSFIHLYLPEDFRLTFNYKIVQHGWTWSNRSILSRWRKVQKNRGRSSERYLKVATWLLPRV